MLNLLQKLFPFSSKSSLRILDIQISWRHQMPKHRIRNTFYWITWEVNIVCKWNLTSWCHITKEKMWSKSSIKTATWKLIQGLFALTENYPKFKDLSLLEIKSLKRATYIRYGNSTTIKICTNQFAGFLRFLFTEDFWKLKRPWNWFPVLSKISFMFDALAFDDVMIFEYPKS